MLFHQHYSITLFVEEKIFCFSPCFVAYLLFCGHGDEKKYFRSRSQISYLLLMFKKNCTKTHYTIFVHKCVCQNWEGNPFSFVQRSQCFFVKETYYTSLKHWSLFFVQDSARNGLLRLGWNRTRICESELYGNPEVCSLFICFHIPL